MEELARYDGRGRCRKLEVVTDTRNRYEDRLWRWAADAGWTFTNNNLSGYRTMQRDKQ